MGILAIVMIALGLFLALATSYTFWDWMLFTAGVLLLVVQALRTHKKGGDIGDFLFDGLDFLEGGGGGGGFDSFGD